MATRPPGDTARALLRRSRWGALATALAAPDTPILDDLAPPGWPTASSVAIACGHNGVPLMLLSNLALHSRNIAADDRVSLLLTGPEAAADPLAAPRLTVFGRARPTDAPEARMRFVRRHPEAEAYAGFSDFVMYRLDVEAAHWIGGFGDIRQISASDLLFPTEGFEQLVAAEARIVDHMNADHADAIALFASKALELPDEDWRMSGCDPEGIDLIAGEESARLDFDAPVNDAEAARNTLVALTLKLREERD